MSFGIFGAIPGIIIMFGMIILYFLPSIIGARNHKKNQNAIILLNLFLGWSGIGWIIALIWAVMVDDKDEPKRKRKRSSKSKKK